MTSGLASAMPDMAQGGEVEDVTERQILLIEDNQDLAEGIRHNLELEGYSVTWAATGDDGLELARECAPDLVILDIMLPGRDGFDVLRQLRRDGMKIPVLILTARAEEADKVRGFRLDAQQYVTKPFGLLELLERVRSLLRTSENGAEPSHPKLIEFGQIVVDPGARTVTRGDESIPLTPRAFDLLVALARNRGRVTSRLDLLREVWGHRAAVVTRTVDSHVSELRQKLEEDPSSPRFIHTVWKVGYRFDPSD